MSNAFVMAWDTQILFLFFDGYNLLESTNKKVYQTMTPRSVCQISDDFFKVFEL